MNLDDIDFPVSYDWYAHYCQQAHQPVPDDPIPETKSCNNCYHYTQGFCACREQADVESGCNDWTRR